MGIFEDLLSSLARNTDNLSEIQKFRAYETLRDVVTGAVSARARDNKTVNEKEVNSISKIAAMRLADLDEQEEIGHEEVAAAEECAEVIHQDESSEKVIQAQERFINKGKEYDEATQKNSEKRKRAREIIADFRTSHYISDKKIRHKGGMRTILDGMEDAYFDAFQELYGEKGVMGYKEDYPEDFLHISDTTAKLASNRFKIVHSKASFIKELLVIPLTAATLAVTNPYTIAYAGPIVGTIVPAIAYGCFYAGCLFMPESKRAKFNNEVTKARYQIARRMGLFNGKVDFRMRK